MFPGVSIGSLLVERFCDADTKDVAGMAFYEAENMESHGFVGKCRFANAVFQLFSMPKLPLEDKDDTAAHNVAEQKNMTLADAINGCLGKTTMKITVVYY